MFFYEMTQWAVTAVPAGLWLAMTVVAGITGAVCLKRTRTALIALALVLCVSLPASADAPGGIRQYGYPEDDTAALHTCIQDQGGTVGETGAWQGVSQAIINQCQMVTVWKDGKWNWSARILLSEG